MPIDIDLLLRGYANGVFPMADARDDANAYWVEPKRRAILPLDGFRVSQSLGQNHPPRPVPRHRRYRNLRK